MRVALYARVSTTDKGQNPKVQLTELRQQINQRGWDNVGEFVDYQSGAKGKRPQLDRLVSEIKKGGIDGVIVVRLDRLGRTLQHLVIHKLQRFLR